MKIVVAFEDTPEGREALERGKYEARLRDAELVVAHSRHGLGAETPTEQAAAARSLELVQRRLEADGVPHRIRRLQKSQSPGEDIVEILEEEHADLVIIGLRTRPLTAQSVVGDNAAQILMRSPCPVMCVRV